MTTAQDEIAKGERFSFGKNWQRFLAVVDDERISESERAIREMLDVSDLRGKTFLDVGSGSGLSSLAAWRLGSDVRSFDYDQDSVDATKGLKDRFAADAKNWSIGHGSILDDEFVRGLGQWDVVYSWGVLHHTGNLMKALTNAGDLVKPGGRLFISIYNDLGRTSTYWKYVKRLYNANMMGRVAVSSVYLPYYSARVLAADAVRLRNPLRRFDEYKRARGMSIFHDWLDWLGGYPYEPAKPEVIFEFFKPKGFTLDRLKTEPGGGCNEFVFSRRA